MALGPQIVALYHHLRRLRLLEHVSSVAELGPQGVSCPDARLLDELFDAFGKPRISQTELASSATPSRLLHERLGLAYQCFDPAGTAGPKVDLNVDSVAPEHRGRYHLVSNYGIAQRVLNQHNCFKYIHDLAAVEGYMVHAVPFAVHADDAFFSYQPNFFAALARFNSYRMLGMWLTPDPRLSSLIPWEPRLLEFSFLDPRVTRLLVVVQQKMFEADFCVPLQGVYEAMLPQSSSKRYRLVADGEYYSDERYGRLVKQFPLGASGWPGASVEDFRTKDILRALIRKIVKRG